MGRSCGRGLAASWPHLALKLLPVVPLRPTAARAFVYVYIIFYKGARGSAAAATATATAVAVAGWQPSLSCVSSANSLSRVSSAFACVLGTGSRGEPLPLSGRRRTVDAASPSAHGRDGRRRLRTRLRCRARQDGRTTRRGALWYSTSPTVFLPSLSYRSTLMCIRLSGRRSTDVISIRGLFSRSSGAAKKVALALLASFSALLYSQIQPPPSKIPGTPGGPPVTAPRTRLKDGRHLAYLESGVPKEKAKYKIIFVHGFDCCRYDVLNVSQVQI
jgi:hypothetical protein